jgi:hypothetical protein
MNVVISYSVTLATDSILSIRFIVKSFSEFQAYPLVRIKTINIDLNTGKRLTLKGIININSGFVDTFFDYFRNQKDYKETIEEQAINSIERYVMEITTIDALITCDEPQNIDFCSYLTEDSLGISIGVPHSGGSYTFYESTYLNISKWLIRDIK